MTLFLSRGGRQLNGKVMKTLILRGYLWGFPMGLSDLVH